jgi:hypothetical protein
MRKRISLLSLIFLIGALLNVLINLNLINTDGPFQLIFLGTGLILMGWHGFNEI